MTVPRGIVIAASAIVTCVVVRRGLVVVTVRGGSMRPAYSDGDRLLAARWRLLRRGWAIVFTPPTPDVGTGPRYRVKRLVAVPGDPTPSGVAGQPPGALIPAGRLVVRGDNQASEDSRHYGYIARTDVLAVVIGRLSPAHDRRRRPHS